MQWKCLLPPTHLDLGFPHPSILIFTHKVGWGHHFPSQGMYSFFILGGAAPFFPCLPWFFTIPFFSQCTPFLPSEALVNPPQSFYDFSHFSIHSTPTPKDQSIRFKVQWFKVWKHLLCHYESTIKLILILNS
jgi:hypothetical protein